LASGTSSWSTKLVHGGLRYLEYYEFRLVREALIEREILWQIAPHIIRPLRFVLPHHAGCARPGCCARPVPVRPYRRSAPASGDTVRSISGATRLAAR
jgi:glycerol-3-phosphate dehydrogenase